MPRRYEERSARPKPRLPCGMVALAFAVLLLGTTATASARPKKHGAEPTSTAIATCNGTPIIMQGIDCKKRELLTRWQRVAKQPLPVEVVACVGVAVGGIIPQAPVKWKRLIKLVDLPTGVVDGRLLGQRQR